ncbi:MAG: hypothetical protein DMF86_05230 [Acidobacteria bacterium]|nr:MAG: hypothetical protein DMF86_05230 [Acidobacteriota bacterium]
MRITPVLLLLALIVPRPSLAQQPPPPSREFEIKDNSFLVEEAFNQEAGIVQHIFGVTRENGGGWQFTFTQEWPAPGEQHQLSYTLAYGGMGGEHGFGDTLLNYRFRVWDEGPGRPACAPRLSLVVPTGRSELENLDGPQTEPGFGFGSVGLQVNVPFSKQRGDWYWHWNAGFTWLPRADSPRPIERDATGRRAPVGEARKVDLLSPHLAGSAIFRLRPMVNVMLESAVDFVESPDSPGTTGRDTQFTLAPGVRAARNLGENRQIVVGAAAPITWSSGDTVRAVFISFSFEGPMKGLQGRK